MALPFVCLFIPDLRPITLPAVLLYSELYEVHILVYYLWLPRKFSPSRSNFDILIQVSFEKVATAGAEVGAQESNLDAPQQGIDEASFDFDPEDLWEAISHCASPINAIQLLSPFDALTATALESKVIDTTLVTEAGAAIVLEPSSNEPSQDANVPAPAEDKSTQPDQVAQTTGFESLALEPSTKAPNEHVNASLSEEEHTSDRTILPLEIRARPLDDPDVGKMQYDDDGKPVIPPGYEVRLEIDQDDRRYITILNTSEDYSNLVQEELDYPEADTRYNRPIFVYGRKYRYEHWENGELKMNAPKPQLDHYNYAEHCFIGNELKLKFPHGTFLAEEKELTLENGVKLTYGQINGLGGDFFGTYDPICKGENFQDQCDRYQRAYACLGRQKERTPWEVKQIVDSRDEELRVIREARQNGRSTAEAYKTLTKDGLSGLWGFKEEAELSAITLGRADWGKSAAPSYVKLAQINFDHFGEDARRAYNAGHYCAMQEAARPDGNLEIAYAMNAFADHYLGDCFAAGHMRTPRRALHATYTQTAYSVVTAPVGGLAKFSSWLTGKIGIGQKVADAIADRSGPAIALAPDMCSKVRMRLLFPSI